MIPPALDRLAALATRVACAGHLWRPWVRHDSVLRWHIRLSRTSTDEVWLLCWTAGQGVELHDHGGSAGAFCVVEGELVEEHPAPAGVVPARVRCPAGVTRAFPPAHRHAVKNAGPLLATSIHVYSPPLSSMTFYDRGPDGVPVPGRTEAVADHALAAGHLAGALAAGPRGPAA